MVRVPQVPFFLVGIFSCLIFHLYAINLNCLWCCRDPEDPQSNDTPNNSPNPIYRPCKNRPLGNELWAPDGGWACDPSKVDFPTVDCLAADMRSCGNVGDNSVFYSFGGRPGDARAFRDTLNPKGTMFNDALDDDYTRHVIIRGDFRFHISDTATRGTGGLNRGMNRQNIYTARYCEAFAKVSTGTAYLVVLRYEGHEQHNRDGRPGIFQEPLPPDPNDPNPNQNLWGIYELPTLQRQV